MNTPRTLIAATLVTLLAAGGAVAQEATPDTWTDIQSTLTRAEVRAAAVAALDAGVIPRGEASRRIRAIESRKTRAQVRAETIAAMRLGLIGHGEASGPSFTPAQAETVRQAGLGALRVPVAQVAR